MSGHKPPFAAVSAERSDASGRVGWIDAAKGLCIILVVLFHSTLGVEKEIGAQTWMHTVIEWARPFRMPDFFLISGLFLAATIGRPWRAFLNSKVVHFGYFYLLWFHIHFGLRLKALIGEVGAEAALRQYVEGFIDPFGSLWFIYLLAVYCVVTKLLRNQPVWLVAGAATLAHVATPHTGIFLVDEFFSRFLFFYVGYAFSAYILGYARVVGRWPFGATAAMLAVWAGINTIGLTTGLAATPMAELAFAAAGIAAVIAFSVVLTAAGGRAKLFGSALAYCGRNSIVIYLAFTVFMALMRTVVLKTATVTGIALDGGVVAIACAVAGLTGALTLHLLVRGTRLSFLFERPEAFRLSQRAIRLSPRAALRRHRLLQRT